ncbi:MAG: OmpA family protein [Burkholderiaceae bacterium]|jgi:outer membrane protein OmpA-like peptidoglycan-associated protein|nr:OmpA family protein [Burkholderiaceae bacterium]
MFFQDDDNYVPIVGVVLATVLATVAVIVGVAIKDGGSGAATSQANSAPSLAASVPASAPQTADADGASVVVENGVVKFYFASGKADLAAGADAALKQVAEAVAQGHSVVVSGYHDTTGSAALNAELAKKRAFAVRDALEAQGIAADRITLEKPAETSGGTSAAEARRVEVTVK